VPDASAEFPGSWKLEAEQGSFAVEGDEDTSAIVSRVKGQLLRGESVESRFTADSGEAQLSTGRLLLEGHVRVTSERDKVYLTADKVTYDEKRALIVAEGRVEVHSDAWMSGPYDRLVATPGLERVGTADRFGL
jgi:lipopolysaccharide assembly outer membrane protein LptD (OstA)